MRERPILFQGAMVRAILDGSKTQTRRIVKPQPPQHTVAVGRWQDPPGYDAAWWAFVREGALEKDHPFGGAEIHGDPWRCPYGQPSDRLWVREAFARIDGQTRPWIETDYRATYKHGARLGDTLGIKKRWTPSIHMPRHASRITLEITDVRVERLQDISEADAITEGQRPAGSDSHAAWGFEGAPSSFCDCPVTAYAALWKQINGGGSWDANPWVWVVEFKRLP